MCLHLNDVAVRDSTQEILELFGCILGIKSVEHIFLDNNLQIKGYLHVLHCRGCGI